MFNLVRKPVIFGSDSLSLISDTIRTEFEVYPPIKRGDLDIIRERAINGSCVIIIDGVFGSNMSITPQECRSFLSANNYLLGSSSMGALRAADCYDVGMIGIGDIFMGYHLGYFHSDSDVAVLYDSDTYQELTVSLVQVDHISRYLSLNFDDKALRNRLVIKDVKRIPWYSRNISNITDILTKYYDVSDDRIISLLKDPFFHPKKLDAKKCIDYVSKYFLKKVV